MAMIDNDLIAENNNTNANSNNNTLTTGSTVPNNINNSNNNNINNDNNNNNINLNANISNTSNLKNIKSSDQSDEVDVLDSIILSPTIQSQSNASINTPNLYSSFDEFNLAGKLNNQCLIKDPFLISESSHNNLNHTNNNLIDLNLFTRLTNLMDSNTNNCNTSANNNNNSSSSGFNDLISENMGFNNIQDTNKNTNSSLNFCSYCSRPTEYNLTTLECNIHRICHECLTFSVASSMSSRKNSDSSKLDQSTGGNNNTHNNSQDLMSKSKNATNNMTTKSSTCTKTNGNTNKISCSISNTTNVSESSGSIDSLSASSSDENHLDERFANSTALKCKLCSLTEKNNEINRMLLVSSPLSSSPNGTTLNSSGTQRQNQQNHLTNNLNNLSFYDTMFDLFPHYSGSAASG
jgi:hypothetical protein